MGWIANLLYTKLKTLLIIGSSAIGGGTIIIPSAIAGNRYEEYLFREFNPTPAKYNARTLEPQRVSSSTSGNGQYIDDQSKFENFKEVSVSNAQLIKGTKSYNSGNYVIYFGSEACPNCNNVLYSERESPKTWMGTEQKKLYENGILFETYSLAKNKKDSKILKDVKFIFFSDEVPSMNNRNNDDLYTIPWNRWPITLTSQGKVEGDYIRYDKSAVNFRKLQSLLFYYFGSKAQGIPTIIIYRNGVPFVYGTDKLEHIEADKKKTGEHVSSIKEAEAESTSRAVILRYDLFKHLSYIYDSEVLWYL